MSVDVVGSTPVRRVGVNSFVYTAGDLFARGAIFIVLPLYTRALSTSEYGTYGVVLSVVGFLNVLLPLQFNSALTMHYFQTSEAPRRELMSAIGALMVLATVGITAALVLSARWWAPSLFPLIPFYPYLLLAFGIASFSIFGLLPQTLMRLREQSVLLGSLTTGISILGLGAGVILLTTFHRGVPGLLLGALFANVAGSVLYLGYIRSELTLKIPLHWFPEVVLVSLPLLPHMIAHWGLNLMDRLVLQQFVTLGDVGIYQLGYQFGMIFQIVVLAFNNAWVPYFFRRFGEPSWANEIRRTSTWMLFVQAWIGLGIALLAPEAILFAIPAPYHRAIYVVPWVVLGFFMVAMYHQWVNPLLYHRRTTLIPIATAAAAIANLALNLALIPRIGFMGAAISTAICYGFLALLTWLIARRFVPVAVYEPMRWVKIAAMGLALYLIATILPASTPAWRLGLRLLLSLSFPLSVGLLRFWTADDLKFLGRLIRLGAGDEDEPT